MHVRDPTTAGKSFSANVTGVIEILRIVLKRPSVTDKALKSNYERTNVRKYSLCCLVRRYRQFSLHRDNKVVLYCISNATSFGGVGWRAGARGGGGGGEGGGGKLARFPVGKF